MYKDIYVNAVLFTSADMNVNFVALVSLKTENIYINQLCFHLAIFAPPYLRISSPESGSTCSLLVFSVKIALRCIIFKINIFDYIWKGSPMAKGYMHMYHVFK